MDHIEIGCELIGCICLRRMGSWILVNTALNAGSHKRLKHPCLSERLLASEEELCSDDVVSYLMENLLSQYGTDTLYRAEPTLCAEFIEDFGFY